MNKAKSTTFQALVVDDEPSVRQATARSLTRCGFNCEVSSNAQEAAKLIRSRPFDLVVTDLRMPGMHGHQLAVDLLSMANRPILSVLTGIQEPKLAKDLIARGVEQFNFKPVDYGTFAAEALKLVIARARDASAVTAKESAAQLPAVTSVTDEQISPNEPVSTVEPDITAEPVSTVENAIATDTATSSSVEIDDDGAAIEHTTLSDGESTLQPVRNHDDAPSVDQNQTQIALIRDELIRKFDSQSTAVKKSVSQLQSEISSIRQQSYVHLAFALLAGLVLGLVIGAAGMNFLI